MYVNFTSCQAFVDAVSRDGRSYSPELFRQAEGVLLKIGSHLDLIGDLQELAVKVKASADSQEADETLFADAPEHFLDAIMSVLMRDPVKLPSSGQVQCLLDIVTSIFVRLFFAYSRFHCGSHNAYRNL